MKQGGNSGRILGALLVCALVAVSIQTDWRREPVEERAPGQAAFPHEGRAEEEDPVEPHGSGVEEIADRMPSAPDMPRQEPPDSGGAPAGDSVEPDFTEPPSPGVGEIPELVKATADEASGGPLEPRIALDEFEALGLGDKVMPAEDPEGAEHSEPIEPQAPSLPGDVNPGDGRGRIADVAKPAGDSISEVSQQDPDQNKIPERAPIVFLEPATLAGRLLVDPGVPMDILRVELEELLPNHGGKGRFLNPVVPDGQGVFTIHGVQPGLVALRISLWGTNRALVWVDEIELAEAEQRLDPSGCEVSLLGRLQSREVEVLDEFGLRIEPAVCFTVESRDHSFGTPRVQSEDVTPRIWMERNGVELLVLAPDCEPRRVSLEPGSKDSAEPLAVALQPMPVRSLELRFLDRELLEGLPSGFRLQAKLLRANGLTFPWDDERHRGAFDDKGKLRLEPADCGQFEVHLSLLSPSGGERPLNRLPELVEILPAAEAQHVGSDLADAVQVVHLRGFSGSLGVPK